MNPDKLPDELQDLASSLGHCSCKPPERVKQRVMQCVKQELDRKSGSKFWHYVAISAAGFVIMANLFFLASRQTQPMRVICKKTVQTIEQELRESDLGLSEEEITRQSVLMAAGEQLIPMAMTICPDQDEQGCDEAAKEKDIEEEAAAEQETE